MKKYLKVTPWLNIHKSQNQTEKVRDNASNLFYIIQNLAQNTLFEFLC